MKNKLLALWGKTDEKSDQLHPLLFHMLDTGYVCQVLWQQVLPLAIKQDFSARLGIQSGDAGNLIAFWCSLHDIGKASPAFQRKHAPSIECLQQLGFDFPDKKFFLAQPHGIVTSWILSKRASELDLENDEAEALGRALGGHHGTWPDDDTFYHTSRVQNLGSFAWQSAQMEVIKTLKQIFQPPEPNTFPSEGFERNVFLTLLSGLISVCDWLASNQASFEPVGMEIDLEEYCSTSIKLASNAVVKLGWEIWNNPTNGLPITFKQAFPDLSGPRPVQTAVFNLAYDAPLPTLALIEAPTGIGKTEIAFLLADRWLRRSAGRGFYIAMPTQATSNQMYSRSSAFLNCRYPGELVQLHLAHSHAILSENFEQTVLNTFGEDQRSGIIAASWFLPHKRTLLAPYGVGTVDQAFLSVLQTRHFFVRLFGLHSKVVIFDEVHAYDAYQSELFCRLLQWLRALNTSIILLSATLPGAIRERFITAYGGKVEEHRNECGYPRLTLVNQGSSQSYELPQVLSRRVDLVRIGHDPQDIVQCLRDKLSDGGCAAVICNTVSRAQVIYQAIKQANLAPDQTYLFHARFPFAWRKRIEDTVLEKFGPRSQRPDRAIVVATQVIEQSLDLDFDLLISELAPIDLLIQRAGRLHRHARPFRPQTVSTPKLVLMDTPSTTEGDPDFGPDKYIYRYYHLLKTEALLKERTYLTLPEETPFLIETVYSDTHQTTDLNTKEVLNKAWKEMNEDIAKSERNARKRIVLPPEHEDFLVRRSEGLEEDAPDIHEAFQALTREAPPGANLVCLHRLPDGRLSLEPGDRTTIVDHLVPPTKEEIKQYLKYTVQAQRPDLVKYLAVQPSFEVWKDIIALRYHTPIVFEDGQRLFEDVGLRLQLDPELGLSIVKEVS